MNVQKVNNTLLKAVDHLRLSESQALAEMYTGTGGMDGEQDNAPSGDPLKGGEGGVDNLSSAVEAFESYIEQVALAVAARCNVSVDSALDSVVEVADMMAEKGEIPPMPDPESAEDEELSGWAGAAKQSGFVGRVIAYCMEQGGDVTQNIGGGTQD